MSDYHVPRAGFKVVDLTKERVVPAKREPVDEGGPLVEKVLTRFKRSFTAPAELEDLRYRLIQARVANGLLAVEAAQLFGYANSTQLSLIESGERPIPKDFKFVAQAARVYSVSVDWLLGLVPDMDRDAEVLRRHALLRGTRSALEATMTGFARISAEVASRMQLTPDETADVIAAVESIERRFRDLCERGQFDDLPGGAPVAAAIAALTRVSAPLHRVRAAFAVFNDYVDGVQAGRLPEIDAMYERHKPRAHAREVLREDGD
ncbi:helix-turn-helix transcriptional regulator [Caballeronia sp. dw_19]|uniref:helix-turn-helix domain-containing protein n=1 Tax=Caballeronia sp. dw_19 TaxID=2719791 RepID=UPI001BD6B0CA|nr:helix-turn-helix transcriptional regulator [Caballeronia sp. dw_19]